MPYFKNDKINVLLIHIPKTGGTSLEFYFSKTYNIALNPTSLNDFHDEETKKKHRLNIDSSLQHMTYQTIMNYKTFFNIDMNNLDIISIVRNPYDRIISDLFWHGSININSSKEMVYEKIKSYLHLKLDNHNIPQYLFVTDENKELIPTIKILRTETLQTDMINLGYTNFNNRDNCQKNKVNYYDYLNNNSIKLINHFYDYDFKLFNYEKKETL